MKKTLFVALCAMVVLGACDKKDGAQPVPAPKADSSQAASAAAELVLKPSPAQIAAAHRVGNKHCPTDGEKLGSMGAPIPVVYKGELVELCCPGCPGEFAKDPAKYLAIAQADTASK